MNLLQEVQLLAVKKQMPDIRPGVTVKISQKIKEGDKTRIQHYQGLVIKINSGYGADKTITVRKVTDGVGVEKTFPLYSTNIDKITVVKSAKVRRAKLYYLRERFGKSARMREELLGQEIENSSRDFEVEVEEVKEEVKVEETIENTETPVEVAPVEVAPVEETPVEVAPVEETPVEVAPVEETPVEEAPAEEAPAEEAPAEEKKAEEDKEPETKEENA
ncbi:MAG: 50S ribosomal protein L19 [Candidatus Gracilibacteria bacterium]|jgi:large subunit ribosomal protein L19|nr:50S ribosomal protein L19 [Candidatus Gracilibacteria bacterium]